MAEVAFSLALQKLSGQLESGLQQSAGEEVLAIMDTIDEMKEFLNDADRKRERNREIGDWVTEARGLAYGVEDLVDEFEIRKEVSQLFELWIQICVLTPLGVFLKYPYTFIVLVLPFVLSFIASIEPLVNRFRFLKRLQEIKKRIKNVREDMVTFELDSTAEERSIHLGETYFTSSDVVGMEREAATMEKWLLAEETNELAAIFVVGMVGTGKSTLAWRAYECTKMRFDCYAWVFVTQSYTSKDILRDLLKGFYESTSETAPSGVDEMDDDSLRERIAKCLQGKKYLVVLDNVLDESVWEGIYEALPSEYPGAKVVFTTRNNRVPDILARKLSSHTLSINLLSEEDARTLFRKRVLSHSNDVEAIIPSELEAMEEKLLKKCDRLPLAIVTIGALLSTKAKTVQEWQKVLDKLDWHLSDQSSEDNVFVSSGYADLSPALKRCFLYCSVFPENYVIPRKRLIRLWVAEGFVQEIPGSASEEVAGSYFKQLIERNMLQIAKIGMNGEVQSCRLLYLMRSFAHKLSVKDKFCIVSSNDEIDGGWGSFRRLSIHGTALITPDMGRLQLRRLRALLIFGKNDPQAISIHFLTRRLKLLLVLELQGIRIKALPRGVGDLLFLRYLGLRGTGITKLPKSLKKLNDLETLDIRQTAVRYLPDLYHLKQLRHLYFAGSFTENIVIESRRIMWLANLQTLSGIKVTGQIAKVLRYLTKLRKLSVGKVKGKDSTELCDSINKLKLLRSLTINCDYGELLNMERLAQLPLLEKLGLGGHGNRLLNWVVRLESLSYLYLWDSKLKEDPLSALQNLPNLVLLSLFNAYEGKQMYCGAGGFPKLKKLSVLRLRELEAWGRIESGAMLLLEKLFIGYCSKLNVPPQGLDELPALEVVQVIKMSKEFEQAAQHDSMNQKYKVQIIPEFISAPSSQDEAIIQSEQSHLKMSSIDPRQTEPSSDSSSPNEAIDSRQREQGPTTSSQNEDTHS